MPEFEETCDYHVEVKAKGAKALLVDIDGEGEHWIPFSQICDSSDIDENSEREECGVITVSEWIALEKGLE